MLRSEVDTEQGGSRLALTGTCPSLQLSAGLLVTANLFLHSPLAAAQLLSTAKTRKQTRCVPGTKEAERKQREQAIKRGVKAKEAKDPLCQSLGENESRGLCTVNGFIHRLLEEELRNEKHRINMNPMGNDG